MTDQAGNDVGRVKIDWLGLTFPWAVREDVAELLSSIMGERQEGAGRDFYRSSWRWESGAVLLFNDDGSGPRLKDGTSTCSLSLSGSVLDWFTPEMLRDFMRRSWELGARCSRLDAAFDDFTRRVLRLDNVIAAAEARDFAGFRTVNVTRQTTLGELSGLSVTFGRRGKMGSGRVVQFYDKTLESNGEIDAVRMEARFAKEHAHGAFMQLVVAPDLDGFTSQLCGIIGGSIRFVERDGGSETHLDRCAPLAWWDAVLELLSSCRVVVRRAVPPLQKSLAYLKDSWALNLALMFEIAESEGRDGAEVVREFMRQMIVAGKLKLDAGRRPGAKALGLDFDALLCA